MTADGLAGTSDRAVEELATAASTLVARHDVIGTVTGVLAGCVRSVNTEAAGIVVAHPDTGVLDFLAATSHRAEQLELFQVHEGGGPAAETIRDGAAITVRADEYDERWPDVAAALHDQGVSAVHAHPMKWQDTTLGALNLFFTRHPVPASIDAIAHAFSDLATLAIVVFRRGTTPVRRPGRTPWPPGSAGSPGRCRVCANPRTSSRRSSPARSVSSPAPPRARSAGSCASTPSSTAPPPATSRSASTR
ncbi:GAF domain-containing protein [Kribbella sp. NPDC051770]|uniref:GAF domain-containing protein n=1 Tax=Kribbella sp. NPDC051770 TaxID=3155413 RepID=UPI00343A4292